ncbi:hypothetical protein V6Z11_D09G136100 [Gossypium hirsutum]
MRKYITYMFNRQFNRFSYPKSKRLVTILNEIPLKRMRYDVVAKGYCCIICFHAEQ